MLNLRNPITQWFWDWVLPTVLLLLWRWQARFQASTTNSPGDQLPPSVSLPLGSCSGGLAATREELKIQAISLLFDFQLIPHEYRLTNTRTSRKGPNTK